VDTVLGLSVTPTNVQTVLVEGQGADGATLERDEFEVLPGDGAPAARASEQVAEAVLSIAEAEGHRLHAIGVTWSDDADMEALRLLDSLAELGLDNVVAVKLPEAAEALACSIGRVIGYERTAVCVVEPETVILSLVDTFDGEVETLMSRAIDSNERLIQWVTAIFGRDDWLPEGLFVVGSVGGLEVIATELEHALSVPVFDPPESDLALAHGAALASAAGPPTHFTARAPSGHRKPRGSYAGAMTMLVAGAVTFVVSVTLALGPLLVPDRSVPSTESRDIAKTAGTPAVELPAAPPPPVAPVPAPELPAAEPAPPPEAVETVPVELPAPEPEAPSMDAPEAVAPDPPAAPPVDVPPPVEMPPSPEAMAPIVPVEKPGILTRIRDKLRLGNNDSDYVPAPPG
jgi:hypothetical protein